MGDGTTAILIILLAKLNEIKYCDIQDERNERTDKIKTSSAAAVFCDYSSMYFTII